MVQRSFLRRMLGRSLLRGRHLRARPIGECPLCGHTLEGSEDWLDAERVMGEHLRDCERDGAMRIPRSVGRPRPALGSAL
jgi:hypothetical protein